MHDLSSWLVTRTNHGIWDWAGLSGGFLLGLVTVFGGFVALKSFLASTQAASHAHMHQMFPRFLEARDAFSKHLADPALRRTRMRKKAATSLREDLDFGGSVLYFLEEVFAWTVVEETLLKRLWMKVLIWPCERRRRMDIVRSWRATILAQLLAHERDVLESLKGYSSCYGCDFLSFAAMSFNDPDLKKIARESNAALRKWFRPPARPLGTMEAAQPLSVAVRQMLLYGFAWRDPDKLRSAPSSTTRRRRASLGLHPFRCRRVSYDLATHERQP